MKRSTDGHPGAMLDQGRQEGQIGEDDPILGVIDDVAELIGDRRA